MRIGRESYSWFEILEMDLPNFKKIAKLREVNDIKRYMKKSLNLLKPRLKFWNNSVRQRSQKS